MKMYSRDDLMKNNFGAEGDDDDEDDEDNFPKNLVKFSNLSSKYVLCLFEHLMFIPVFLPGKRSKKQESSKERS